MNIEIPRDSFESDHISGGGGSPEPEDPLPTVAEAATTGTDSPEVLITPDKVRALGNTGLGDTRLGTADDNATDAQPNRGHTPGEGRRAARFRRARASMAVRGYLAQKRHELASNTRTTP